MRASSDNLVPRRRDSLRELDPVGSGRPRRLRISDQVRFVPAGWVAAILAILRLLLTGGKIGKLGIAGLVWSVTPRKLKITAASLALAATIMLMGAIAAIALLAIQLT